jgi:fumarate reductase subunit D
MAKSNKALFWSLFAGGGMLWAFVTPVLILVVGIAVPLGLLSPEALSYDRMLAVVQNPLIKIILFGVIFLQLWHAAHRLLTTVHDVGLPKGPVAMTLCYGAAAVGSVAALVVLLRI